MLNSELLGHPVKVSAGYVSRGQGAGPLHVTSQAGLFDQQGLAVDIRLLSGSREQSEALAHGELMFGNMAAPGVIPTVLAGGDLVFLTSGINQQFLVGRPGTEDLSQVDGGLIAVNRAGELNDVFGKVLIRHMKSLGMSGLRVVTDIDQPEARERLANGTIDAAVLSPPSANEARRQGCSFLFDFDECGLNFTLGGIVASKRFVADHHDLVSSFLKGYVTGIHRYKTDPYLAAKVQQQYSGIADYSLAMETYQTTEPGIPKVPYPVTGGLEILLGVLTELDPRVGAIEPGSLVDETFIRELDESGYIDALYARSDQSREV
jgi:ABC-type nitrate/sulfonate/bicarbonate transport system substrate-binding protein